MTDITKPQPVAQGPSLTESAIRVAQEIDQMREDIGFYQTENDRLSRALEIAEHDKDALRLELGRVEHERAYYMRWSIGLITELNTITDLVDSVVRRARQGASKPNGAAPASAKVIAAQPGDPPLPKVVTDGPAIPQEPGQ